MKEAISSNTVKTFTVNINGEERRIGGSFYRGDVANYYPNRKDASQLTAIPDCILQGWMPKQPFIGPATNVVAFGSCFAASIGRYLASIGFDVATQRDGAAYIQRINDGLVNVFSICQQFEWAWERRVPQVELWHGWKAEEYGYDEEVRLATKKLFDEADVFILTFGLSEIWYDEPTGEVFWRAVPQNKFDASRHKFRVATIEETLTYLRRIRTLIRTYRPNAKVIFTLSPIALAATFRPVSCVTASAASKALLRAAIDQLYREVHESDPDFFYFPAYEVVLSGFKEPFQDDLRHPHIHVINCNMRAFERYFCITGLTDEDLYATIREALEVDALLIGADDDERRRIVELDREWWRVKKGPENLEKQMLRERYIKKREEEVGHLKIEREQAIAVRQRQREEYRAQRQKRISDREERRARRAHHLGLRPD